MTDTSVPVHKPVPRRFLPANRAEAKATAIRLLREPFRLRSLGELLYAVIAFPIAAVASMGMGMLLFGSALLAVTVVGLPILVGVIFLGRFLGGMHRRMARTLLRTDVPKPPPFRAKPGAFGWLGSGLGHLEGWRGIAFVVCHTPIVFAAAGAAWALWGLGALITSYPVWGPIVGTTQIDGNGKSHETPYAFGDHYADAAGEVALVTLLGIVMLLAAPWVIRGILWVDVRLMHALLGPTKLSARVQDLEETRALAVDDSAARLRRIERDLHDGAQARIVALAMQLGQAREHLDPDDAPADVERARRHVDSALGSARLAITELRDLVRGIHPPVLDDGLDTALATLTAASGIPVDLAVDVIPRPPAAYESIAYFCTAELLTNAQRHSGATAVRIEVARRGDTLSVHVGDDGHGGAATVPGGGLAGLVERVRTVDGTLTVDSPPGGPTRIGIAIPVRD